MKLTKLETRLLQILIANAGHVVSTERLLTHVWGHRGSGDRQLLKQLVHRLRQKIEADPAAPRYLQTESGAGYRIAVVPDAPRITDSPAPAAGTAARSGRSRRISASWLPRSMMRPPSSTTIWSAMRTVEKRCEIRIAMRSFAQVAEVLEDLHLGRGIHRRGRLVEHQDVGVLAHERARERDLLPLPARELAAVLEPLAELRVVAAAAAPR